MTDNQAMADIVARRSTGAFSVIVDRYVALVRSTAVRVARDSHAADDVTQAVFILLWQRAASIHRRHLPGWLVNTSRLAALHAVRARKRLQRRATEAVRMRPEPNAGGESAPEEITSLLDGALSRLSEPDRSSLVMRFLQGRSFIEVGSSLGISEEAARKRVERALQKLRGVLNSQGVNPSILSVPSLLIASEATPVQETFANHIASVCSTKPAGAAASIAKAVGVTMSITKTSAAVAGILLAVLALGGGLAVFISTQRQPAIYATLPTTRVTTTQPMVPRPFVPAPQADNESTLHMHKLLLWMMLYQQDHNGQWANRLQDLYDVAQDRSDLKASLINPLIGESGGYIYEKPADKTSYSRNAENVPVLFEAKEGNKVPFGAVGYADGHVVRPHGTPARATEP